MHGGPPESQHTDTLVPDTTLFRSICIGYIWRPGLASAHLHCPHATMHAVADPSALQARLHRWSALWPGLALAAAVAATAILAARLPALQALGMGDRKSKRLNSSH